MPCDAGAIQRIGSDTSTALGTLARLARLDGFTPGSAHGFQARYHDPGLGAF